MNLLRSVFISLLVAYLYTATAYALAEVIQGASPVASWIGLALAAGAPAAFFSWVFLTKPARTAVHPLGVSIVSGLGLAVTMAISSRFNEAAGIVHYWSGLAFIGWIVFLRWYSPFKNRKAPALEPGKKLPEFELQTLSGETVSSKSFIGRPGILLFYRGNWCPYCSGQVIELSEMHQALEELNVSINLISPQPVKQSLALSGKAHNHMKFFHDPGSKTARLLGIDNALGTPLGIQVLGYDSDTVLPTVVICDESGTIIYTHQTDNYRRRPGPKDFLKALEKHHA
jgi:peroxiredoxin